MATTSPVQRNLPRRNRLQFSLRSFLLLVTATAIGLVFYCPTWEEPLDAWQYGTGTVGTVSYRRGWNRKRVKHGWTRIHYADGSSQERLFENDELRQERTLKKGKLAEEKLHLPTGHRVRTFAFGRLVKDVAYSANGNRNGVFWADENGIISSGNYKDDKRTGPWRFVATTEIIEAEYEADELHGHKRWLTSTGRVLQTAEYEQGRLVAWNSQPLAEELPHWVEAKFPADPVLRINLLRTDTKPADWKFAELSNYECRFLLDESALPIVIRGNGRLWSSLEYRMMMLRARDYDEPRGNDPTKEPPLPSCAEVLLTTALHCNCTLSIRFGVINVIPITAADMDWRDRTGVYDVHFAPGSEQEHDWLSLGILPPKPQDRTVDLLRQFFDPRYGSPIAIDTTAVDALERPSLSTPNRYRGYHPRIRRDLVGQYLDEAGFRCELRDEVLFIKPQSK